MFILLIHCLFQMGLFFYPRHLLPPLPQRFPDLGSQKVSQHAHIFFITDTVVFNMQNFAVQYCSTLRCVRLYELVQTWYIVASQSICTFHNAQAHYLFYWFGCTAKFSTVVPYTHLNTFQIVVLDSYHIFFFLWH